MMRAVREGSGGLIDDDLAYVAPWGFDPAAIGGPALLLHGSADSVAPIAHGEWLGRRIPSAELWAARGEGHISVLRLADAALEWLVDAARAAGA